MDFEKALTRKITLRIIPFVMVLYTAAYVDRSAVGFAQLHMQTDIGIDAAAYGFGAGLFFLAYFLFEVPSNWILPRVGPRRWFARILVTWGLITALMAAAQGPISFYILRFLLGAAEAGFYPGILYYLTEWYPQRNRTKATGAFVMAAPLAFLIMSPLAGWLLGVTGLGMVGWQWLFVVVGGAAVLLAIPTLRLLHDSPHTAPWITEEEAAWIDAELEKDRQELGQADHKNPFKALLDKNVLLFAVLFFPSTVGVYGLSYWLPQVVSKFAGSDMQTGLLTAVPYIFALIGIWITSRWAARFRENWIPLAVIFAGAAVGIGASALVSSPLAQLACLSLAAFCLYSIAGVFWALPTLYVIGATAAVGIAAINSFGNLGGFVGPYVVGIIAQSTGTTTAGMLFLSGVLFLGAAGTMVAKAVKGRSSAQRALSDTST
ncbi:MFS transporter [Propionibacterium australiense]|uniref:MFS transporter n=1 Tax=Propionibacterium australiense TaxID=119981 RepID=A0A383S7Y3_9ACTN|nr:MFS transporter [Propionibacterium australiense]RLP09030.1 MFS transporter [Propionibacterium australiense]RLP09137.1 MFS transporter [Propionibacterium australiense]SYZ33489.1 Major Facilitator Superfamily [Propionibacterium australiense]VEH91754.1 Inner membrane transport protein RhmT [Propionibacterium australiense]